MKRGFFAIRLVCIFLGGFGLSTLGCANDAGVQATADDSPKIESASASASASAETPREAPVAPKPVVDVRPAPPAAEPKPPEVDFSQQESWAKYLDAAKARYGLDPAQAERAALIYESYLARADKLRLDHEAACQSAAQSGDSAEKARLESVYRRKLQILGEQCVDRIDQVASVEQVEKALAGGFKSPRYREFPADPDVGRPAANFELKRPNGETVSLQALKGKVVVIKFWGSWCGFCRKSLPSFEKLRQRYKDNPKVAVLGVSCEKGRGSSSALKLMETEGYTFDVLLNGEATAAVYQVRGYPTTYIVGPDGKIIHKQRGFITDCDKVFGAIIDRALKG